MRCSICGKIIEDGEYYYSFDDADVCHECIEDYIDDYKDEHHIRCTEREEDSDPRYEPEYWEDR